MDVWGVFAGDSSISISGSMRNPYYRDYEQFPYGTLEQNSTVCSKDSYSRVQEKCQQVKLEKASRHCPFCKEQKKRPLVNYMRKRESRKHHESICEDEEVEEEVVTGTEADECVESNHHIHDGSISK